MKTMPAIIGIKEVVEITGLSRMEIHSFVNSKRFPKPLPRTNINEKIRWKRSAIKKWVKEDDDNLDITREQLNKLIDQRIIEMLRNPSATSRI